jgi:hypothetical protein
MGRFEIKCPANFSLSGILNKLRLVEHPVIALQRFVIQ